jgi:hypothetical protein
MDIREQRLYESIHFLEQDLSVIREALTPYFGAPVKHEYTTTSEVLYLAGDTVRNVLNRYRTDARQEWTFYGKRKE